MKELVQSILVYIVIVSALRGVVANPKYGQYFQFFSGMVLILLLLSPILSILKYEEKWYGLLEEKILQMDLAEMEGEMQIADGWFADVVEQKYQETAEEQIRALAKQKGVSIQDVMVTLQRDGKEWAIAEISVTTEDAPKDRDSIETVETIQMDKRGHIGKEDTSKPAKSLRRQICTSFAVGEDTVHIWKEKGNRQSGNGFKK